MKKKNIINKLIVAPLVMGFMSCTGNYMDINSNPYQPGDLTPDDYALGSAMSNLASTVISSDVNTAQFTDCLLGGPLGGYFADSNAGWSNTISNFNATNDWTRVFLISDRIISTLYGNLSTVKQVSENTNNPVPYAIAQIIKVAAMSRVTDAYGPIPYSKIGQDGKITIPYDTQEEVYNAFFKELDESIEVLTENRNAALVASADFVYSGNVQKWVKFANSLKLRLAIRIANVSPAKAKEMAESAVNHELGLIETNADNATWKYFGTISNPLFVAVRYNEEASGGDTHPRLFNRCPSLLWKTRKVVQKYSIIIAFLPRHHKPQLLTPNRAARHSHASETGHSIARPTACGSRVPPQRTLAQETARRPPIHRRNCKNPTCSFFSAYSGVRF